MPIELRSSVFEENSAAFVEQHRNTSSSPEASPGHRTTWTERATLCVAKLAHKILPGTKPAEYAKILLKAGKTPAEDQYVEVHICGPATIRTLKRVAVSNKTLRKESRARRRNLEDALNDFDVSLEVIE